MKISCSFVAIACATYIISMFATHSNAVPLSVIAPSSPHSLSNIKVQTLEHKDHVRLYPRGDTVHEEVLLTTTTFQHPHLDDWITVINNRYIQTSGFPDFKERTIEHFDFLKSFLFEKLKKPIVTLMKYEGLYVKRFVTMVILGQRWMDFDAVRADVRSQQGDQWTRMEHYLTVLKSLCDNEELKKYQEVHKFLVNSFKGAKERLKVILGGSFKFSKDSADPTHNPVVSHIQSGHHVDHLLDLGVSDDREKLDRLHPPLQPTTAARRKVFNH